VWCSIVVSLMQRCRLGNKKKALVQEERKKREELRKTYAAQWLLHLSDPMTCLH